MYPFIDGNDISRIVPIPARIGILERPADRAIGKQANFILAFFVDNNLDRIVRTIGFDPGFHRHRRRHFEVGIIADVNILIRTVEIEKEFGMCLGRMLMSG